MWKAVSWYNMWLRISKIFSQRDFCLARLWHKFLWYESVFLLIMMMYSLFVVWCFGLVWNVGLSILYVVHFCKFQSIILVIYSKIPLTRLPIIHIFWSSSTWGEQYQDQKFCILPEESFISETGRSQGHVLNNLQECLYINHCFLSWWLSSIPSTSSAIKTPQST
jgi:hypothetical protein